MVEISLACQPPETSSISEQLFFKISLLLEVSLVYFRSVNAAKSTFPSFRSIPLRAAPELSGHHLVALLRENKCFCPFLFSSGWKQETQQRGPNGNEVYPTTLPSRLHNPDSMPL
jgi:hypothetical protein